VESQIRGVVVDEDEEDEELLIAAVSGKEDEEKALVKPIPEKKLQKVKAKATEDGEEEDSVFPPDD
jgi:hypothetical protein